LLPLRPRDAIVLVDLSQVGRPFLRLVRERGINAVPCMIDGSDGKAVWSIPSRELISTAMDLVGEKRFSIRKGAG
jgi:hypothetical protein